MKKNTLLIIGLVWPEPNSSAAGSRMLQLIKLFLKDDYRIYFASTTTKSENAFDLDSIGIATFTVAVNDPEFDDLLLKLNPDTVMFDRFMTEEQFGWRVADVLPDTLRVLDTEDLHFLRKGREAALKKNVPFTDSYLLNEHAKREIASIYRCDITLIISEFEMHLLQQRFAIDPRLLLYLPFLVAPFARSTPDFENRQHFITIGNFIHQPNYDAVRYLKTEIWPAIHSRLPEAEMHVYGAYESSKVTQLHNAKQNFLIKGFAHDVHEVMQAAKVCLAPLRFGAGLKGKLIDAMLNETPCVMSGIAAEGMFDTQVFGYITDDPMAFAEYAVNLYTNQMEWEYTAKKAKDILKERFSESGFSDSFLGYIKEVKCNLVLHRQHNFIGSMLNFHTMRSTKYMSKWIETKNKLN